jgi:predicted transcriptional regulator
LKNTKPSKLELFLEILKSLENKKASKLAVIRRRTNLDNAFIKQAISFLEKQNLVEKRTIKNKTVYKNTSRGERINRYFIEQNQGREFAYVISDDVTYNSQRYP